MSFEPFTVVTGRAAALLLPNIDTDVIIRVERMTSTGPAELAPYAFEALHGPEFVLSTPAQVLLAGENFGCGSSREPAVWALQGLGVRCVLAPSFGDIFQVNCQQNGVLAIALPGHQIAQLAAAAADAGESATVDLPAQQVTVGAVTVAFHVPPLLKAGLLAGMDDLELSLQYSHDVTAWEEQDRTARPWAWLPNTPHPNHSAAASP